MSGRRSGVSVELGILDRIEAFYVVRYSCDVTEVKNNNPGGFGGSPPTYELLRASQVIDFSYY
jgi:hypothetical protein